MEGKDNIEELFSQKLGNYEAQVNPELWAKISSQVAVGTTTTAAAGLSVFAKVAIGLGISAAAITTVVILSTSTEKATTDQPKTEVQENNSTVQKTEAQNIAEVVSTETIESNEGVDVLNESTTVASNSTITATVTNTVVDKDVAESKTIDKMIPKGVKTVSSTSSEPKIVEGITYAKVTQYGSTPIDDKDIVIEEPVVQKSEPIKRFVNTFTPNGDGQNDYFELKSEGLTDFSVVVFDPSGDIVFKSEDPNFRWDGRDYAGNKVTSGTYMYMVSAYDSEGNPYPIYERLTIVSN